MTKREAAIVSLYTGNLIGEFEDLHKYVCELIEKKYRETGVIPISNIFNMEAADDFKSLNVL